MKIKSANQAHFAQIPSATIPRSQFNRSHGIKLTMDADYLVPCFLDEVLPGDTFNLKTTAFGRLATPLVPIMDNLHLDFQFWFVPTRLVWNNWEKFNGAQDNPGDSIAYTIPQCVSTAVTGYANQSLQDYMGLPTKVPGKTHNNLPLRCYNLIYNTWYRSEDLQNSVVVDKDDGPDSPSDYVLLKRGKRHDYFTSCLPWPQKGSAVSLPLGTSAPVVSDGNYITMKNTGAGDRDLLTAAGTNHLLLSGAGIGGTDNTWFGAQTGLEADLSVATAATINELREAFQVQKLLERDARGGTRYIEIILSHFGVRSPDARLQRPELLSSWSVPININPVAQTSSVAYGETGAPLASLAAFGTVSTLRKGFVKSFTEHGYILGIMSLRADLNYQQGLNKLWSRSTRYDFYWPAFAHIGEQVVLKQEIYCDASATDDDVFGYNERFAEYRYKPNQICGKFRSNDSASLDIYHLAQDFGAVPSLNATFIESNTPLDRVIAVPSEPHLIVDLHHDLKCARPMPVYSVPGLIDHF